MMTVAEGAAALRSGRLSPLEWMEDCLRVVARLNPVLRAFNRIDVEGATAAARRAGGELEQGRDRGPLHGVPFGVKDVYDVAGLPTTGYSWSRMDHLATRDATAVQRLREAGAICVGKLATHELANGGPSHDLPWPPARNPWDIDRVTGGSSTGAGAAVAAGLLPAALGSDTSGSIRIPASLCGVVGIKPTWGRVSRAGVIEHSATLDHCGPMAWTVEDCALLLQAMAGPDPRDPAAAARPVPYFRPPLGEGVRGWTVGVVRYADEPAGGRDGGRASVLDRAGKVLRGLGATLREVTLPSLTSFHDVRLVVSKQQVFASHLAALTSGVDRFGADFLGLTLAGALYAAGDVRMALAVRGRLVNDVDRALRDCNVLLAPASGPAARFADYGPARVVDHWQRPSLEAPFSVTGHPALTVCAGFDREGLPLGIQVVGRHFDEESVFRAGHALEKVIDNRSIRPLVRSKVRAHSQGSIRQDPPLDPQQAEAAHRLLEARGVRSDERALRQCAATLPYAREALDRLRAMATG
jgi:aspartyl-tRNA(Asn)/glutamyl-tRNA(Gln) amidotransferase subunit A